MGRPAVTFLHADDIKETPTMLYKVKPLTGCVATIELRRILKGTFEGERSTYIGLLVTHRNPKIVKESTIKIMIHYEENTEQSGRPLRPQIVKHRPAQHYGTSHPVDEGSIREVEAEIGTTPIFPVYTKITASASGQQAHQRVYNFEIVCTAHPVGQENGRTVLDMRVMQNGKLKNGVLQHIPVGLIVKHGNQRFVLSVELKYKAKFFRQLLPIVTTRYSHPVRVSRETEEFLLKQSDSLLSRQMDQWTKEVWKELVKIVDHGEEIVVSDN